jgi:hypothetical protein
MIKQYSQLPSSPNLKREAVHEKSPGSRLQVYQVHLTKLEAWVCALQGILHLNKIIKFLKTII